MYSYDPIVRVSKIRHCLNKQSIGNGATFSFGYNPASEIKGRTINNDASANTAVGLVSTPRVYRCMGYTGQIAPDRLDLYLSCKEYGQNLRKKSCSADFKSPFPILA